MRTNIPVDKAPFFTDVPSQSEMGRAYSWYKDHYDFDSAKEFTLDYWSVLLSKSEYEKIKKIPVYEFVPLGWICHLLKYGSEIMPENLEYAKKKIQSFKEREIEEPTIEIPKVSVKANVANLTAKTEYAIKDKINEWLEQWETNNPDSLKLILDEIPKSIKVAVLNYLVIHYRTYRNEIDLALEGKDGDLNYIYRNWTKPKLKKFREVLTNLINILHSSSDTDSVKVRKPRKKKIKTPAKLAAKAVWLREEPKYNLKSNDPTAIIGSSQVWLFNVKTRTLSVCYAAENELLSIKGTTIINMNEKTSITKILRKPEEILPDVISGGKVTLKGIMGKIKTHENLSTGRLNSDTIILRCLK